MSDFFLGLDLGQSHDPTAIVIVQKLPPATPDARATYQCRHIERLPLMTPYPGVVDHVRSLISQAPLTDRTAIALDYTGVGRPVADMFRAARLGCQIYSITITGGDTVHHEGFWYRVPQRDLIGAAQVLFQSQRLSIAKSLPAAATLITELSNFRVKINQETAHDSYSAWRTNQHDDLVFALSLAVWVGEHERVVCLW